VPAREEQAGHLFLTRYKERERETRGKMSSTVPGVDETGTVARVFFDAC